MTTDRTHHFDGTGSMPLIEQDSYKMLCNGKSKWMKLGSTWKIIPVSKRLITMAGKSHKDRVVPLQNGQKWLVNGGDPNHLLTTSPGKTKGGTINSGIFRAHTKKTKPVLLKKKNISKAKTKLQPRRSHSKKITTFTLLDWDKTPIVPCVCAMV